MIADLLLRTKTQANIDDFKERILGNAFGNNETAKAYVIMAKMKIKRFRH